MDKSNGYEAVAEVHMQARRNIGVSTVREWATVLPRGAAILDVGCGNGVPVSQALIEDGFSVYGIDASATMIGRFRERFPNAPAECSAFEDSNFFGRTFEGVLAWGLIFLLSADAQRLLIAKVARALTTGGRFLFTSPSQQCAWPDAMTGRPSISLGLAAYEQILAAEGLTLLSTTLDEGENHYYFAMKP